MAILLGSRIVCTLWSTSVTTRRLFGAARTRNQGRSGSELPEGTSRTDDQLFRTTRPNQSPSDHAPLTRIHCMGSQCRSVVDAFVNALLPPDIQCPNGRQAAVANARATNLPMGQRYRPPRNNGRNGAIRFAGIVTSARRAGRCIARRNGCHGLDRENRVGLREICRVSRREISQAGRDALALARLAFSFLAHPGSRKYGGGSCNPSVMRSYFAPT